MREAHLIHNLSVANHNVLVAVIEILDATLLKTFKTTLREIHLRSKGCNVHPDRNITSENVQYQHDLLFRAHSAAPLIF